MDLCGQDHMKRYVTVHDIIKSIPQELPDILPDVHSLTGCDTTSKISTKYNAIKTVTTFLSNLEKMTWSID